VPDIAKSWTADANGLGYTFQLQSGAKFSDGSPITAKDVVFSLERAAKGDALKASLAVMSKATAVDATTVKVTLKHKSRVFLNALARAGNSAILSEKAVDANPKSYFTTPSATSGAWVLKSYVTKDRATFAANPDYFKTGYPKIKSITYTFSADPTSATSALDSGTSDMYFPMAPADAKRLAASGKIKMYAPPSPGVLTWGLDKTKPPFDDVRVRQAFAYMVPRADRLNACWEGIGGVSYGATILPGSWAYSPGLDKYKVSKDQALATAGKLLDEAGWKGSGTRKSQGVKGESDGTSLTIKVPFENNWDQARCSTQLLQSALKPLGVDIKPQAYDAATFYTDAGKGKFTMFHAGDGWATVDDMMEQGYTSNGLANSIIAQWKNPEFDKLVAQAEATQDLNQAKSLYLKAQQIILDQAPVLTTGAQYSIVATTPKLQGFYGRADNSNRALITSTLG
jgi:peptide/nickel transport system substrate-binding protein